MNRVTCVVFLLLSFFPLLGNAMDSNTQERAQTKYPLVLLHGPTVGYVSFLSTDYFFGILPKLRENGATVYTPELSNGAEISDVGEVLLAKLEAIQAQEGHQKFHLIGHGPYGVSARYVASVRPALIASVTTIGAPNYGENTDALLNPFGIFKFAVYWMGDRLNDLVHAIRGVEGLLNDTQGLVESGNYGGMEAFNKLHPQGMPETFCGSTQDSLADNGVHYFSITGNKRFTNFIDVSDYVFLIAHAVEYGPEIESDGITSVCRAHWGKVVRDDYPWNYFDEVNLFFGLRGLFSPDPATVYINHANRLKTLGL